MRLGALQLRVLRPSDLETSVVDIATSGGGRVAVSVGTGRYVKCGCSKELLVLDGGK